ncbi:helix-turn-helix domain-containing protein [Arthrobacter sp. CAN_A2]|uniref:helix-turn-helix domain-containing protein n=1 Tax=Arthrobacter sp. CAN_A2 TaxID=2787718 RepID=UPI0018EF64E8
MVAACAPGRNGGRPKLLDSLKIDRAKQLHQQGSMTPQEIADAVGVSVARLQIPREVARQRGGRPKTAPLVRVGAKQ